METQPWAQAIMGDQYGGSPADVCTNYKKREQCDTSEIFGLDVLQPELLPICLGALIIGFYCAFKTKQAKGYNWQYQALTFAMTGTMMTDAGWNDCILPGLWKNNNLIHAFFGIIDVGLTSTIGMAFLFDGLIDVGILKPDSKETKKYFLSGMGAIFIGWYFVFFQNWDIGFLIMYMLVVAVGCGSWVMIQLYLVFWKGDYRGFQYAVYATIAGAFGFFSLLDSKIDIFLCEHLGCHFSGNFWWFLVTDICIYYIYRYYQARIGPAPVKYQNFGQPAFVIPMTQVQYFENQNYTQQ